MKQYISKFLKSVAAFFIIFPIGYILLVAMLFDIPMNACAGLLLSPSYYIVAMTAVAAGYGLWEMKRWSWYLFLISQGLIIYENAYIVFTYAESHHKFLSFSVFILIQMILTFRVTREIRVPYLFPKIRWWESNPKYRLTIPAQLKRATGEIHEGEILDLSLAGCFLKFRYELDLYETVSLQFNAYNHPLEMEGSIVWSAQSSVTHPKGVGIKFGPLTKIQKRSLRAIGHRLRRITQHYRRYRYLMNQEEFQNKLNELQKNDSSLQSSSEKKSKVGP